MSNISKFAIMFLTAITPTIGWCHSVIRSDENIIAKPIREATVEELADFARYPLQSRELMIGNNPLDEITNGELAPKMDRYFWIHTSIPMIYRWHDGFHVIGCFMWYQETLLKEDENYEYDHSGDPYVKGPDGVFRSPAESDRKFDLETCTFDPNR